MKQILEKIAMKQILEKIAMNLKHYVIFFYIKIENLYFHKIGHISDTEYIIRKMFLKGVETKGHYYPYQSYPPLNIKGQRPSASRVGNYGLLKYIDRKKEVLDIGGNVGFLSLYLSQFAKNVDIVEYAKYAADIGKYLQKKEKIKNVNIINGDFGEYKTDKKYDLIMSFAVHWWVGIEFNKYLKQISELLKEDGFFIIESHFIYKGTDRKGDDSNLENQIKENGIFKIIDKGVSDDDNGVLRNFFILQK